MLSSLGLIVSSLKTSSISCCLLPHWWRAKPETFASPNFLTLQSVLSNLSLWISFECHASSALCLQLTFLILVVAFSRKSLLLMLTVVVCSFLILYAAIYFRNCNKDTAQHLNHLKSRYGLRSFALSTNIQFYLDGAFVRFPWLVFVCFGFKRPSLEKHQLQME